MSNATELKSRENDGKKLTNFNLHSPDAAIFHERTSQRGYLGEITSTKGYAIR